jgi:hypothetical protein
VSTAIALDPQSETFSLRELDSQALVNHIVDTLSTAMATTLKDLEPYIREVWRRLDEGEVIKVGKDEYRTKKEFCGGVLSRTYRAVHYMLNGGNQNRSLPTPDPGTVQSSSEPDSRRMSVGWNGHHQTEFTLESLATLKVGDVLFCYRGKGRPMLQTIGRITAKRITTRAGICSSEELEQCTFSGNDGFPTEGNCFMRC